MRVIIAGSRSVTSYQVVAAAMREAAAAGIVPTVVLCGMAQGVDLLGLYWAQERRLTVERHPADWTTHGKAAGPIRNRAMAAVADAAVVVWDGVSRGSANMRDEMEQLGKPVYMHRESDYSRTPGE